MLIRGSHAGHKNSTLNRRFADDGSSQLCAGRCAPARPGRQQGTLANGFQWQVLSTPQRPSDRVEIRLSVNTGSLTESTQQTGFSHFIPRLALTQSGSLQAVQVRSLWQQAIDPKRPLPPAVVSYDYTMFNLSLPNNRNDLLKEALTYLADASGNPAITPDTVNYALSNSDMVATGLRIPKRAGGATV